MKNLEHWEALFYSDDKGDYELALQLAENIAKAKRMILEIQELMNFIEAKRGIRYSLREILHKYGLVLDDLDLDAIPSGVFRLKNLTRLYLRNNNISEIPKEICLLKNLTRLYLSNNNISEIPKEIYHLKNLYYLDLDNNNISEMPKQFINT